VAAISFHHAGESSLILKDYVHGLPHCIGCGSCVNICPTGALQMEESGDERILFMSGTIINRIKLQDCQMCGARFAPMGQINNVDSLLIKNVENLVRDMGARRFHHLCPDCRRRDFANKMPGRQPETLPAEAP